MDKFLDNGTVDVNWQETGDGLISDARLRYGKMSSDWSDDYERMLGHRYLDGYMSCREIMAGASRLCGDRGTLQFIPAVTIACGVTVKCGDVWHGYLPAIGQLIHINSEIRKIRYALMLVAGDKLDTIDNTAKHHLVD